jgi:hypothetical protein
MLARRGARSGQKIVVKIPSPPIALAKQSAWSYIASGVIGAVRSAAALFSAGLLQTQAQLQIATENASIEKQKLALEERKLVADREKMALDRDRFEYSKIKDADAAKDAQLAAVKSAEFQANTDSRDHTRFKKSIEMQNNTLQAQAWFACLSATAQVRQPVAVAGQTNSFGGTAGSVEAGKDSIKCLDKFKDVKPSDFATTSLPQ